MQLFNECDDGTLTASVDRLQDLIINRVKEMESVYFCLDALVECSDDVKTALLSFIYVIMGDCDNAKIIVSSRIGDSELSESLECCPEITISSQAVARDIEVYIKRRISQGPKRLRLAQSDHMINRLTSGAEGMCG